jgi:hypothetical protein
VPETVRTSRQWHIVVATVVTVAITVGAVGLVALRQTNGRLTTVDVIDPAASAAGGENILLVGLDSRTDAEGNPLPAAVLSHLHAGTTLAGSDNTDTMIVVHVPAGGSSATATDHRVAGTRLDVRSRAGNGSGPGLNIVARSSVPRPAGWVAARSVGVGDRAVAGRGPALHRVVPNGFACATVLVGLVSGCQRGRNLALFQGPDAVQALLANTQTEDAATRQVADAATAGNVPIVQVTETLPADVTDYDSWMGQQIDALSAAHDKTG